MKVKSEKIKNSSAQSKKSIVLKKKLSNPTNNASKKCKSLKNSDFNEINDSRLISGEGSSKSSKIGMKKNIKKELDDFMKTLNFSDFYDEKGNFIDDSFVEEMTDYEKSLSKKKEKSKNLLNEESMDKYHKLKVCKEYFGQSKGKKKDTTTPKKSVDSNLESNSKSKDLFKTITEKSSGGNEKNNGITRKINKEKIKRKREEDLEDVGSNEHVTNKSHLKNSSKNSVVVKNFKEKTNVKNSITNISNTKFNLALLNQHLTLKNSLQKASVKSKNDRKNSAYAPKKTLKCNILESGTNTDSNNTLKEDEETNLELTEKKETKVESLKKKLVEQLQAGAFRYVNEKLYTQSSSEAKEMFQKDRGSFNIYHQGYMNQIKQWPLHPLTLIRKWFITKPKNWIVADFGCGDARLAASIPQRSVKSLDLVAVNPKVIACDMANTPLESQSVDVAVFCLSLMGTNLNQFILEANRVLKIKGIMKIAEVESRFEKNFQFIKSVERMGFKCCYKNIKNKYFWLIDFIKESNFSDLSKLPEVELKPCLYKKR